MSQHRSRLAAPRTFARLRKRLAVPATGKRAESAADGVNVRWHGPREVDFPLQSFVSQRGVMHVDSDVRTVIAVLSHAVQTVL